MSWWQPCLPLRQWRRRHQEHSHLLLRWWDVWIGHTWRYSWKLLQKIKRFLGILKKMAYLSAWIIELGISFNKSQREFLRKLDQDLCSLLWWQLPPRKHKTTSQIQRHSTVLQRRCKHPCTHQIHQLKVQPQRSQQGHRDWNVSWWNCSPYLDKLHQRYRRRLIESLSHCWLWNLCPIRPYEWKWKNQQEVDEYLPSRKCWWINSFPSLQQRILRRPMEMSFSWSHVHLPQGKIFGHQFGVWCMGHSKYFRNQVP